MVSAPRARRLGYQARSYLHYLGLNGYAWFDWEWLLAVARHRILELDERLGLTLRRDVDAFIQEAVRLGYVRSSARQSIFWAVSRIVLHAGDARVAAINETQVDARGGRAAVRRAVRRGILPRLRRTLPALGQ